MERTHENGTLRLANAGEKVTLVGWVAKRRNLGSLVFIDLRDRSGIVQLTFDESIADAVKDVRNEYILQVIGTVEKRKDANPKIATGEIEIHVESVNIVNSAETAPITIADDTDTSEDTRLKYRYLDLRRSVLQQNMILRHKVCMVARNVLDKQGFVEIETPILARSTPEGARDYLVPSRIYNGKFWALPQSPQIYKQLLMIGGMEKYFQIARCFRDEDLRADRQPEFTQIDVETSFLTAEEVRALMEEMIHGLWLDRLNVDLGKFPQMTWHEAMNRFGSDKPDLRNPLELVDVADILKDVEFKVFHEPANSEDGRVTVLRVPNGAALTRKQIDEYTQFVGIYGAKGLAWAKINDVNAGMEGIQSPVAKFLNEDVFKALIARTQAQTGDILFFGADKWQVVTDSMGALRLKVGRDLGLTDLSAWKPLWVVDFPMFDYDEEEQRYKAEHHPFTSIKAEDLDKFLAGQTEDIRTNTYDLVLNGSEIGGGSIRIFNPKIQSMVFDRLGLSQEEAKAKFGFFLDAFKYGAPPHGGLAFGIDRWLMVMLKEESIRDVIPFPKTNKGQCLMTEAPNTVDDKQLEELFIKSTFEK